MKLRLHGTSAECATATQRLRRTPGLPLQGQSRPYPHRRGELVRLYLTVHLDPYHLAQPGQRAGDRGSGSPRR